MTPENNSEPWPVIGEVANSQEIAAMEGLAKALLQDFPAEYQSQYGYSTEEGSCVMFSKTVYEEDIELGSTSAVVISKGFEDTKFSITFGYDNKPMHLFCASEDELGEMTSIVQDLLDSTGLQPADDSILRHVQAIMFCMMNAITPENIGIIPVADQHKNFKHVAEVIRTQVDKNTSCVVSSKVWGLEVDKDKFLTIVSYEIIGELAENDDPQQLPLLLVEYIDRVDKINYIYTKSQNGSVSLGTEVLNDTTESIDDTENEGIENEVAAFLDEFSSSPEKAYVELLTQILLRASFLDLSESSG